MREALLKHVREAGLHTSWTEQEPAYEEAVAAFVAAGPCGAPGERVAALPERAGAAHPGERRWARRWSQLTMPGVPDVYQGTESEYLALVDPDNRRPVRFPPARTPADEKAALTAAALRLRARRPGGLRRRRRRTTPLPAEGPAAGALRGLRRSGRGGHGRHPAVAAAGGGGRLAGHGADAARRAGGPTPLDPGPGVHGARARGGALRAAAGGAAGAGRGGTRSRPAGEVRPAAPWPVRLCRAGRAAGYACAVDRAGRPVPADASGRSPEAPAGAFLTGAPRPWGTADAKAGRT